MNKSLLVILSLGLFLGSQDAQALTKTQVAARTITFAGFCVGAGYLIPFWCKKKCPIWPFRLKKAERKELGAGEYSPSDLDSQLAQFKAGIKNWSVDIKKDAECPLVSAGAASVVGGLGAMFLFKMWTPKARYKWATKEIAKLNREFLFVNEISEDTVDCMLRKSGCQSHELPLVKMFLELQKHDRKLTYMIDQLERAAEDEGFSVLAKKCRDLVSQLNLHLERIRKSEACVQAQDKWLDQWRLHQKRELQRERMYATQTHVIWHI